MRFPPTAALPSFTPSHSCRLPFAMNMHLAMRPCTCLATRPASRQPFAGSSRQKLIRPRSRGALQVVAVGWDPDGILPPPREGHINRRMLAREMEKNSQLRQEMETARVEARQQLTEKREGRKQPTTHAETVEYLLDTEGEEMNFEVARTRPLLTDEFFNYLSLQIGELRFGKVPNEERLAELEALKDYLQNAVKALDEVMAKAAEPAERLRNLLQSQDKRAHLLEMASNNEIDQPLLDLLKQNIAAAQANGQEKPAEFMQKIHDAAQKFLITFTK